MIISSWNEEREATLAKLWAEGYSMRQIAVELGGVTRNAVCGKVHRMGLSAPMKKRVFERKPRDRKPRSKLPSQSIHRIIRANGNSNAMRVISVTERATYKLKCVDLEPIGKTLIDLEKGDCREPYGDGPFTFCGHPAQEGSSYCTPHHHLNWEPRRALTARAPVREVA